MSTNIYTAIQNFDLLDYVIDAGGEETKIDEYALPCPSCGKSKLVVNVDKKTWHCWVCETYRMSHATGKVRATEGAGGLISLIQTLEDCSKREAIDKILMSFRLTSEQLKSIDSDLVRKSLDVKFGVGVMLLPPDYWNPITGILPYMHERDITVDDAQTFGLGWCHSGRYANRLIFPVWEGEKLVFFQGRAMWAIGPGDIKALNPSAGTGTVSSDVLMNLDVAKRYPRVAITEGPIDCVKAGPSAVCTFGKKISAVQIAKLKHAGVRNIDMMWDSDAVSEMETVAHTLRVLFDDVRVVRLPAGTDPGDHTRHQLNWYRANGARAEVANLQEI